MDIQDLMAQFGMMQWGNRSPFRGGMGRPMPIMPTNPWMPEMPGMRQGPPGFTMPGEGPQYSTQPVMPPVQDWRQMRNESPMYRPMPVMPEPIRRGMPIRGEDPGYRTMPIAPGRPTPGPGRKTGPIYKAQPMAGTLAAAYN